MHFLESESTFTTWPSTFGGVHQRNLHLAPMDQDLDILGNFNSNTSERLLREPDEEIMHHFDIFEACLMKSEVKPADD